MTGGWQFLERWKEGWTLHQIAQLFDRIHSSIQPILSETGGIRPAQRHSSRLALTLFEREEISRAPVIGHSIHAHSGKFAWPKDMSGTMTLTREQLDGSAS